MKNYLLLLTILFFSVSVSVFAQKTRPNEVRKGMSLGVKEAFTIDIQNLDDKEVEKLLIDYLKGFKGRKAPKKDRKSGEIFTDDAEIPAFSTNTIDIYATVEGKGDNPTVVFWFDLGGAFLSEDAHPEKMEALSEWLYAFGRQTRARTIELELEAEEDRLKDFNKDFDKLLKEQEKLEDTIEKAKQMIAEAEDGLKENAKEQENSQATILEQKRLIDKIKDRLKKVN